MFGVSGIGIRQLISEEFLRILLATSIHCYSCSEAKYVLNERKIFFKWKFQSSCIRSRNEALTERNAKTMFANMTKHGSGVRVENDEYMALS